MRLVNAVIVVAVAVILITIIPTSYDFQADEITMQYDDYWESNGVSSATGSVEMVDLNGTSYVHAKSLGSGTLTYSNGSTCTVTVTKAKLDVFLLAGQSNAGYYDADKFRSPDVRIGTAYYFGTEISPVMPSLSGSTVSYSLDDAALYDMMSPTGVPRIGDKGPAFCSTYYENTGHKVYWIVAGVGSAGIDLFNPNNGSVYEYTLDIYEAAMDEVDEDLYDVTAVAYIWIQGESNRTSPTVDQYKTRFTAMNTRLLSDTGLQMCLVSQIKETDSTNNPNKALKQVAAEVSSVHIACDLASSFTQENGMMGFDNIHYSQKGDNAIGTAVAKYVTPMIEDRSVPSNPITGLSSGLGTIVDLIPLIAAIGTILLIVGTYRRKIMD